MLRADRGCVGKDTEQQNSRKADEYECRTKLSWTQSPAGYSQFAEYIENDTFSFKIGDTISAKLGNHDTMFLSSVRGDKPSEKSRVEFHPIWQLSALARNNTEPAADRGSLRKLKDASIKQDEAGPKGTGKMHEHQPTMRDPDRW